MSQYDSKLQGDKGARPNIVPAGTPNWITAALIEQTIKIWQPYYQSLLAPEDAVIMILNVSHLYQALSSGTNHETVRRTGTGK